MSEKDQKFSVGDIVGERTVNRDSDGSRKGRIVSIASSGRRIKYEVLWDVSGVRELRAPGPLYILANAVPQTTSDHKKSDEAEGESSDEEKSDESSSSSEESSEDEDEMEEEAPPLAELPHAEAPNLAAAAAAIPIPGGSKRKKVIVDPLKPNGVQWVERDKDFFHVDVSKEQGRDRHRTEISWHSLVADTDKNKVKSPLMYFQQSYPMKTLRDTIDCTDTNMKSDSARLQADKSSKPLYPFNKERYFKFLGITLSMALNPLRGGIDSYFSTKTFSSEEYVMEEGGNYGERFGMGLHEYKNIRQYLQLTPYTLENLGKVIVRRIQLFNNNTRIIHNDLVFVLRINGSVSTALLTPSI